MLFRRLLINTSKKVLYKFSHVKSSNVSVFIRKDFEQLSPYNVTKGKHPSPFYTADPCPWRVSFSAPRRLRLKAGMTIETAIALPVFFICMCAVIQFVNVYQSAARLGSALTETAEEMAVASYMKEDDTGGSLLGVSFSPGFAEAAVKERAGSLTAVKDLSLMSSSIPDQEHMIDLTATYRMKSAAGLVSTSFITFAQWAKVREWTGRKGSDGNASHSGGSADDPMVYVARTGVVYHLDPMCSHIHLNFSLVEIGELSGIRNEYGERYHSCEKCGRGASGSVYITSDGNRYHSTLSCSGLSRSVSHVHISDAGGLRPCSKCGGH